MGVTLGEPAEADHLEEIRDLLTVALASSETEAHVGHDRKVGKETAVLGNAADATAIWLNEACRVVHDVGTKTNGSSVGAIKARDDAKKCCLATARRSKY